MARDLRYPVGPFKPMKKISPARRRGLIDAVAALPDELVWEVDSLTKEQLNTPYREGGWTLRQVVHHVADSHVNGYIRMRLAVTENDPTIKPYDQETWAELRDARTAPIDLSVKFIDALHRRWSWWMRRLDPKDFERTLQHPEHGTISVDFLLQLYAWHGRHHIAHISNLTERMGW